MYGCPISGRCIVEVALGIRNHLARCVFVSEKMDSRVRGNDGSCLAPLCVARGLVPRSAACRLSRRRWIPRPRAGASFHGNDGSYPALLCVARGLVPRSTAYGSFTEKMDSRVRGNDGTHRAVFTGMTDLVSLPSVYRGGLSPAKSAPVHGTRFSCPSPKNSLALSCSSRAPTILAWSTE